MSRKMRGRLELRGKQTSWSVAMLPLLLPLPCCRCPCCRCWYSCSSPSSALFPSHSSFSSPAPLLLFFLSPPPRPSSSSCCCYLGVACLLLAGWLACYFDWWSSFAWHVLLADVDIAGGKALDSHTRGTGVEAANAHPAPRRRASHVHERELHPENKCHGRFSLGWRLYFL